MLEPSRPSPGPLPGAPEPRPGTSAELAEQFGLSLANVKTTAHRLRQRYRELLREEIAHTVALPNQIDDEIRHLMKVVSE